MTDALYYLFWINTEIPAFLDKFESFDDFDAALTVMDMPKGWKAYAYAMAKERWKVYQIQFVPVDDVMEASEA